MSSQKIPLFGGVIAPVPVTELGEPFNPVIVFTPPDKKLAEGTQAFYEVHLWLLQAGVVGVPFTDGLYVLGVSQGGGGGSGVAWSSETIGSTGEELNTPIKILDGYPIRGDVTLEFQVTTTEAGEIPSVPFGPQLFGYYYRVGQGAVVESERRYIGLDLGNDVDAGVPIFIAPDTDDFVIHSFSKDRIDEISLALRPPPGGPASFVALGFKSSSGASIVPGSGVAQLANSQPASPNSLRDPQSVYIIKQVPFGGRDEIDSLIIGTSGGGGVFVHGFFRRFGV